MWSAISDKPVDDRELEMHRRHLPEITASGQLDRHAAAFLCPASRYRCASAVCASRKTPSREPLRKDNTRPVDTGRLGLAPSHLRMVKNVPASVLRRRANLEVPESGLADVDRQRVLTTAQFAGAICDPGAPHPLRLHWNVRLHHGRARGQDDVCAENRLTGRIGDNRRQLLWSDVDRVRSKLERYLKRFGIA